MFLRRLKISFILLWGEVYMYFVSFFLFRYRNWCDGQSMSLLLILRVHVQVVYSLLWQLCDMLVLISYPTLFVVWWSKYVFVTRSSCSCTSNLFTSVAVVWLMLVFISYPTLFVVSIAKHFHCLYLIISLTCVFQTCSLC